MANNALHRIPVENWEHKFTEFLVSIAVAAGLKEQERLLTLPGVGRCIPARSGRVALVAALKALDLPPDARIGVPLFSCDVVFKAIEMAGYKACFIDIDPGNFCVSPEDFSKKNSQIDALIAIHMFGNLCDMRSLKEIANDKPIIEDCAQSLGSKFESRMAGSFGTIAFFSFRSGKYLSAGEGGALSARDPDIRSRITQLIDEMHVPNHTDEFVHAVKTFLKSILRSKPLYGLVGYSLWEIYNKKIDLSAKSRIMLSQMYKADLAIAIHRLERINFMIKKQREIADFYTRTLKLDSRMLCNERPGTFYNRYLYPITFPSMEQRDSIAAFLFRKKISTIKPYQDIVEVAAANYGYANDCPATEKISKKLLVIPSHYSLKKADVQRIANCLNEGWARIKN